MQFCSSDLPAVHLIPSTDHSQLAEALTDVKLLMNLCEMVMTHEHQRDGVGRDGYVSLQPSTSSFFLPWFQPDVLNCLAILGDETHLAGSRLNPNVSQRLPVGSSTLSTQYIFSQLQEGFSKWQMRLRSEKCTPSGQNYLLSHVMIIYCFLGFHPLVLHPKHPELTQELVNNEPDLWTTQSRCPSLYTEGYLDLDLSGCTNFKQSRSSKLQSGINQLLKIDYIDNRWQRGGTVDL